MKNYIYLLLALVCTACWEPSDSPPNGIPFEGTGYRPIYASAEDVSRIEVSAAKPLVQPGKIYVFEPYLFINESGTGIHIIDNSDPKNPENISFISIKGNYDIAVKDKWLYADNISNLLVFDLSDPKSPKLARTIPNAIPATNYPPYRNVYFECPEKEQGVIVGWEKVPMQNQPKCFR